MDNRSDKFIFTTFCMMAQSFHAQGLVKNPEWQGVIKPIMLELIQQDVNIIQMPCLETFYLGVENGLKRLPQGLKKYDNPEFRTFCQQKAKEVVEQIKGILGNGYRVVAILGMEFSPSCAVDLQFQGVITHHPGIYIQELTALLNAENIDIPMLGVNKRGMNKTLTKLKELLKDEKQLTFDV